MHDGRAGQPPDVTVYINHGASTQTATTLYRTVKAASVPTGSDYTLPVSTSTHQPSLAIFPGRLPGAGLLCILGSQTQISNKSDHCSTVPSFPNKLENAD